MKCAKCESVLSEEARFCAKCGERVFEDNTFVGDTAEPPNANYTENKNVEYGAEITANSQRKIKKFLTSLFILVVVLGMIVVVANRKSDEKVVYELIPEILEDFGCGLGYDDPKFPKFKSDDMIITDLGYTWKKSGDTYDMFYVEGIVTITTLFGTQIDLDYQMKVGIDKEFNMTGKWYAEIIGGNVFE